MSHFVVLVAGPNYELQLEPFEEGKSVEFEDCTDEAVASFIESRSDPDMVRKYSTLDEYCAIYCGYERRGDRWGYMTNPQAKWDWYEMGGRWTGFLKVKENASGELGNPGVFNNSPRYDADQALKRDIDIESVRADVAARAAETYDKVDAAISPRDPNHKTWEEMVGEREANGENIDDIRAKYHAQPMVKAFKKAGDDRPDDRGLFTWGSVDDFVVSRDEYIAREVRAANVPFAFLVNGEWHEKGSMGWFGCVSDGKDDWPEQFWKLYDALPDNTQITVVDCHI